MALRDWKKIGDIPNTEIHWINTRNGNEIWINPHRYRKPNAGWDVYIPIYYKEKGRGMSKLISVDTKPQALRYAKAYMRKN